MGNDGLKRIQKQESRIQGIQKQKVEGTEDCSLVKERGRGLHVCILSFVYDILTCPAETSYYISAPALWTTFKPCLLNISRWGLQGLWINV